MDAGSVSLLLAVVLALSILNFMLWCRLHGLERRRRAGKAERNTVRRPPTLEGR